MFCSLRCCFFKKGMFGVQLENNYYYSVDVPESKSPDYNISKDSSNGQIQPSDVTTDAIDLGHSVRQRSPPG